MPLICPLCPHELTVGLNFTLSEFIKHIKIFHSHQPDFSITCGLSGCLRKFTNFIIFRNHVSAYHSNDVNLSNQFPESSDGVSDYDWNDESRDVETSQNEQSDSNISFEDLKIASARFLIGLKEKHRLTEVVLQGVVKGVTQLFQCHLSALYSKVHETVQNDIPSAVLLDLEKEFTDGPYSQPFYGLETPFKQLQFYRSHFNLIVS